MIKNLFVAGLVSVTPSQAARPLDLAETVREIRRADYAGDRAQLEKLAHELTADAKTNRDPYRHYWRGFALWRWALNALNEVPPPPGVEAVLRSSVASFREALALRPDWLEAHIGLVGCAGPLFFLAGSEQARVAELAREFGPHLRVLQERGQDNPRALWLLGQGQLAAPAPRGDAAQARALFQRGVTKALEEARQAGSDEPAWIPRWGGAENLMNLAYLHTHAAPKDRALATAYAEGALVAVPEWHYLREILWPQIQALPQATQGGPAR